MPSPLADTLIRTSWQAISIISRVSFPPLFFRPRKSRAWYCPLRNFKESLLPHSFAREDSRTVSPHFNGLHNSKWRQACYLSLSSLRWSMFKGLRLSARTFFFVSLAVCFFPLFWSAYFQNINSCQTAETQAEQSKFINRTCKTSCQGSIRRKVKVFFSQLIIKTLSCQSSCLTLDPCIYLCQIAAVWGTHGGQSLLLLEIILGFSLGIFFLSPCLFLL